MRCSLVQRWVAEGEVRNTLEIFDLREMGHVYTDKRVGLTERQVEESRAKYGENVLTASARSPWWKELPERFKDPLIVILMAAAVISLVPVLFVPGHSWVDGTVSKYTKIYRFFN